MNVSIPALVSLAEGACPIQLGTGPMANLHPRCELGGLSRAILL